MDGSATSAASVSSASSDRGARDRDYDRSSTAAPTTTSSNIIKSPGGPGSSGEHQESDAPELGSVAAEVAAVTGGAEQPKQRRRRRIFSCESCQRLKCRCDYDTNLQTCRRCQLLRIRCSRQDQDRLDPLPRPLGAGASDNRIRALEVALAETQALLKSLSQRIQRMPIDVSDDEDASPSGKTTEAGPERISDPADHAISSAPVVVIRELGSRWAMANRKRKEYAMFDLLGAQLLDPKIAEELIQVFFEYKGQTYHLEIPHGVSSETMRVQSPFLHSVCCLYAMTYVPDIYATSLHQRIYEKVRLSLGQILLTSPLHLEEIQGIFLMSNNATAPSENGPEYIDSWMLTGYCAEQAMLCISFSNIVNNIKTGRTTPQDRAAIRLWATICVHHLRWAATTGRPSVIPEKYIEQCNTLLSFYEATMQDGMLLAEIMLYALLFQKLGHRPQLDGIGECLSFDAWKRKWAHLLSLPTSSMLQIAYNIACLTLCVRSLEDFGERISSTTILSSPSVPGPTTTSQTPTSTGPNSGPTDPADVRALLRLSVARSVVAVLEAFLSMPHTQMVSSTTNTLLAVGYCSLILAHYDAAHSHVPDSKAKELIFKYEEWCAATRGKEWALSIARLARELLLARLQAPSPPRPVSSGADATGGQTQQGHMAGTREFKAEFRESFGRTQPRAGLQQAAVPQPEPMAVDENGTPVVPVVGWEAGGAGSGFQGVGSLTQADFPNFEDFFSGGFLEFPGR